MAETELISPRERWVKLGAMVVAFVLAGVGLQAVRQPADAEPAPGASVSQSPTPSRPAPPMPLPIPDEARAEVWRSSQGASGTYTEPTKPRTPALKAEKVNLYSLEVESSITSLDADEVAAQVQATFDDVRGWGGFGKNSFELASRDRATLRIVVASPETADKLCQVKDGKGLWNCRIKDLVVLNSDRWQFMVPNYSNLDEYRAYALNHEVGKWLGQRVAFCTKQGSAAPVMMDQHGDLDGCKPNAWPVLGG